MICGKFHQNRPIRMGCRDDTHTHTDTQTDRHTDRHIHADENNTCQKTKFLGQVKIKYVSSLKSVNNEKHLIF